jgi:hypothetical protein
MKRKRTLDKVKKTGLPLTEKDTCWKEAAKVRRK